MPVRLHIQSSENILHIDLDIDLNHKVQRSEDSQSRTVVVRLEKEQRDAILALHTLIGQDYGPIIGAIESIAYEAFCAGQKMTRYKHI